CAALSMGGSRWTTTRVARPSPNMIRSRCWEANSVYFSRMYLNPRRRATRNLVGNPQVAHAMVMSAFPPGNHSADDGRILWRLDQGRDSLALYVVSPTKPSFE